MLADGGFFECFLYVIEAIQQISLEKYSLHWQDSQGNLVRRMDNALHFAALPDAPHHEHTRDKVQGLPCAPDIIIFLDELEKSIVSK